MAFYFAAGGGGGAALLWSVRLQPNEIAYWMPFIPMLLLHCASSCTGHLHGNFHPKTANIHTHYTHTTAVIQADRLATIKTSIDLFQSSLVLTRLPKQ